MLVRSVNVSPMRTVPYRGHEVRTGIFKEPVAGIILIRRLGLEGDVIADPRYHGGTHKAVYSYPIEHYPQWESHVGRALTPGQFGENLTTEGLFEESVCLGDRVRVGTAILEAAQPRTPCFKLGIKMGDPRFIKAFLQSGLTGIYWRVIEEGEVTAGDEVEWVERSADRISIRDVWSMVHGNGFDATKAKIVLAKYPVGPEWSESLQEMLNS